jgi:hypothetical protein
MGSCTQLPPRKLRQRGSQPAQPAAVENACIVHAVRRSRLDYDIVDLTVKIWIRKLAGFLKLRIIRRS